MLNTALAHIILVHIPIVVTPILVYIGWKAFQSKTTKDYKIFYWFVLVASLLTVAVYFTGPQTAEWVKTHVTNYPQELVENHALWGRFVFIGSVFAGVLALMAVLNYAQEEIPHKAIPWILMLLLVLNILLLLYTAHLGGMIRRPDLW